MTTGIKHLAAYQANLPDYNAAKDRECNYIGNQIRAARKSMKLSLEQLSQILMGYGVDIGRVAVNKWEKGISIPSAYQLLAVCAALHLEDGFDYFVSNTKRPLLNAEGRRKVKEYREDLIASGKYREMPPMLEIRYLDMPVSDLPVSAGTGAFLDEGNFEMVSFPESSIPDGAEFGVRVSGDSMEPVYHDGQIVWVQQCETLRTGEVGVMIYDGQGYKGFSLHHRYTTASCAPARRDVDRVFCPLVRSFLRVASPGQYALMLWLFSCRCDSSFRDGRRPGRFVLRSPGSAFPIRNRGFLRVRG